jgi:hypothetical protein
MPTTTSPYQSEADVPSYVPEKKRKRWLALFMAAYAAAVAAGKSEREAEERAFAAANEPLGLTERFRDLQDQSRDAVVNDLTNVLLAAIAAEWLELPQQIQSSLETSALSGAASGALQFDSHTSAEAANAARAYAESRSAELVGLKRDADGNLIPDQNANWSIAETTENRILAIVETAFGEPGTEVNFEQVRQQIKDALEEEGTAPRGIFSPSRAEMIATHEVTSAQVAGHSAEWQSQGVTHVIWRTTSADPCPVCRARDGGEFVLADLDTPPIHPHCECVLEASKVRE